MNYKTVSQKELENVIQSYELEIAKNREKIEELNERVEQLEADLEEQTAHDCCEKCHGCKHPLCGECDCDEEEKEELRKRIRELENDSSCKNCGVGKGRVGCGKDCFQDDDERDT